MGKTYQGFAEVARVIRAEEAGVIQVGETIITEHADFSVLAWDIIGIKADMPMEGAANTITALMRNPPLWRSYANGRKGYPWGCNQWEPSDVREWLHRGFLEGFRPEDRDAMREVVKMTHNTATKEMETTKDRLFLLAASEVGFRVDGEWILDEGPAYEFFASGAERLRRKVDVEGDDCYWWLRSPYPSYAYYVRGVSTSGALNYTYAYSGFGLAAACVIG